MVHVLMPVSKRNMIQLTLQYVVISIIVGTQRTQQKIRIVLVNKEWSLTVSVNVTQHVDKHLSSNMKLINHAQIKLVVDLLITKQIKILLINLQVMRHAYVRKMILNQWIKMVDVIVTQQLHHITAEAIVSVPPEHMYNKLKSP